MNSEKQMRNRGESIMSTQRLLRVSHAGFGSGILLAALALAWPAFPAMGAETMLAKVTKSDKPRKPAAVKTTPAPVDMKKAQTIEFAPQISATVGKSIVLRLPAPVKRMSVGNKDVADVILINPSEIYLLGKSVGSTNVILWSKSGQSTVIDVSVGLDTAPLQSKVQQLLPGENKVRVAAAGDSLVVSGSVSDAVKADRVLALAEAYANKKVVNMLQVAAPQQVMLEVKIAEVSKSLLDKLGARITATEHSTGLSLISGFLFGGVGTFPNLSGSLSIDKPGDIKIEAEKQDGLVKILAEPNIIAMSGQEGSFLAGGRIFIPVPQAGVGGTVVTLEEREFGVGLRFTPTVLDGGRINLRVTPEVSEVSQTGTVISAEGVGSSILPTITTRRASTTVQLRDGQSFAIGGLIKNNVTETMKALPVLGELPIIGALFRSSEFQNDKTELLFVVTPRLVKPLPPDYKLPTDNFNEPSRSEFFLGGKLEGKEPEQPQPATPAASPMQAPAGQGGFEVK
jgi:pilus assembly protein CpaC